VYALLPARALRPPEKVSTNVGQNALFTPASAHFPPCVAAVFPTASFIIIKAPSRAVLAFNQRKT
jgi:hypothetical protein